MQKKPWEVKLFEILFPAMVPRLISISEERDSELHSGQRRGAGGQPFHSIPVTNEMTPMQRLPKTAQLPPACFLLFMRQKAEQYGRRVKMAPFSSTQRWSYGAISPQNPILDGGSTYYVEHGGVKNCEFYSCSILTKFVNCICIYQRTLASPDELHQDERKVS